MDNNIFVCDNFLNDNELLNINNHILSLEWTFSTLPNSIESIDTPFWRKELSSDYFFSTTIKEIIEKYFAKKFKLISVYANGKTYGQNGSYHTDSDQPNTFTFCLYLSDIKKEAVDTAGGYLYIKLNDKKYNLCYEPLFNRGIMFPSNYLYKGCSFSRFVIDMRICVTWVLQEIE